MRMLVTLALLLVSAPLMAQAPDGAPVVRTSLDPADGIVIGQPVRLQVEVLFPSEMAHPPLVRLPEAAGAQILRFETQAVTIRDRIGNQDYVGQSFEFVVFPRRGGEIAIPEPVVTLLDRAGDPAGSAKGAATRIAVSVPPGIDPSGPVLVADRVSVSESWSPDPGSARFRAGGALVRTIRRQVDGVPALGMTEFGFTAPDGVRVYVDPPVVEDRANRGDVDGLRTDKVTYVFERPGSYVLPALSQPWWNSAEKRAQTETLLGLTVTVAAAQRPAGPQSRSFEHWRLAAVIGGIMAALWGLVLAWPRLRAAWQAGLRRYHASELFARLTLLRVASAGEPSETYRALQTWLGRLPDPDRGRVLADRGLAALVGQLEQVLFGVGSSWDRADGAALRQAVVASCEGSASNRPAMNPLPPLNPANAQPEPAATVSPSGGWR